MSSSCNSSLNDKFYFPFLCRASSKHKEPRLRGKARFLFEAGQSDEAASDVPPVAARFRVAGPGGRQATAALDQRRLTFGAGRSPTCTVKRRTVEMYYAEVRSRNATFSASSARHHDRCIRMRGSIKST